MYILLFAYIATAAFLALCEACSRNREFPGREGASPCSRSVPRFYDRRTV